MHVKGVSDRFLTNPKICPDCHWGQWSCPATRQMSSQIEVTKTSFKMFFHLSGAAQHTTLQEGTQDGISHGEETKTPEQIEKSHAEVNSVKDLASAKVFTGKGPHFMSIIIIQSLTHFSQQVWILVSPSAFPISSKMLVTSVLLVASVGSFSQRSELLEGQKCQGSFSRSDVGRGVSEVLKQDVLCISVKTSWQQKVDIITSKDWKDFRHKMEGQLSYLYSFEKILKW